MAQARLRGRVAGTAGNELTPAELRILRLIAEGKTSRQIGAAFGNSHETIRGHTRNVFQKLGAHSRAEAVAIGFQRGILPLEERKAG